ncbi:MULTISPECIES: type II and III secretion system protein family protein [Paraburkholderia]|uniref:type II and III secretion system protein family protein n=1 Tax=Paraburkholderia TaxID=1822464 RepID=UPI0022548798|nr:MULTISPECIES: type II and III secretion system protein family protein [Paraburkholderia]MCX4156760.1 type II and III secretion system protein family protein [Paraburkholderia aspalathi]MDN7166165.1 type II and III secretion system protein family protein [Paraburkholderia sp. SECH2]MDQ6394651.1 type II and III secretion system protein family protein [Paraburkholderia aspalathi]
MTKRIFASGTTAYVGCALLIASSAAHAADSTQHARKARPAQPASSAEPAQLAVGQTIGLTVGGQQQVATGHVLQRIALGDPSVADVLIMKGSGRGGVLLVGKAAGTTSLMLWERGRDTPLTYTVNVITQAAASLLGPDTPSVKVLGGTALMSGSSATMEAHQRAVVAAEGSLAKDAAAGKGGAAAKDGAVFDTSTVASRAVVQVDVRVVEFSRSVLKQIGFNFFKQNNGFTFGSFAPSALTSVSATAGQAPQFTSTTPLSSAFNLVFNSATHGLFADLSLMESNNMARVLAEPTLVALSGQSASFLAGGEIPVPVPQGLGTTSIEYKPYGIGLTLTPTVLGPQRIALKVAPEASQLDFANAVTISGVSVPAFTTRRTDTTVELGDGESFVIGGLVDRETTSNISKVPLLGDLPIIGTFFKQLSYQQNEKELVIIVTPHLVSPLAKAAPVPSTPGEQSEQRNGPVWRSLVGGFVAGDAAPGFSK